MENNSNSTKYTGKYDNQIKLRKAKLEKMRKERQILQYDKLMREMSVQENLEENRLKKETREKAKEINNLEIDKIQEEINKLTKSPNSEQLEELKVKTIEEKISLSDKLLKLKCCNLPITEIPPVEIATYSKETQTNISRLYRHNDLSLKNVYEDHDREYQDDVSPLKLMCKFSSNLPPGILSPGLPKVMDMPPALTPIDKENPWNYLKEKSKKIMVEKAEEIVLSEDFQNSLKRVSLAMEKVISTNKNIYVDYIGGTKNDWDYENNSKGPISLNQNFYDKSITDKRCITCIDWSSHNTDQIAASYYKNEPDTPTNAEGDVIIWNRNFKPETAEHVFHCHSSVMSICFTKFNPNLIIGATYSGQIVLWDNRVKTSIPVQCTKLNSKAHNQPIYCLRVIDNDDSSHNIISISSDGKMCSWSLDMLGLPLDVMQLQLDVSEKVKKSIAVNCMDFPLNGINNMVMGAEDGCVYSAFRFGYASGITNCYEKHEAPITSISTHYNQATSTNFSNLFLTSSLDCTIKLWSLDGELPLHTFKNNYDYVMDVAWSPIHPALFAAANGAGHIDLYNLNEDIQEPTKSITTKGDTAINRLKWHKDGQHIAVGTDNGELCVYNIVEDLANPVNDEWSMFSEILYDIRVNCAIESCE
ncbi:cytoplasmic dynein 1 intermediate chain-like [Lucilia sericata]|uniref:cytoplasmic dynein 1 intermediate chain-like n=1 Tax=Lucilia sericata TaxID=13632 RepID=UPI0018A85423|nr:cytoplasmic dynein 1 intermediate chain-like [Lucilia sericata]